MSKQSRAERYGEARLADRQRERNRSDLRKALKTAYAALKEDGRLPEKVSVSPCAALSGVVSVPPSKSYSHRALMVAGLSEEPVAIENPLVSYDIISTALAWIDLGAEIRYENGAFRVVGTSAPDPSSKIFVGESGTTLRFVLPGLAMSKRPVKVKGNRSLSTRPNRMIVRPLREQLGVDVKGQGKDDCIPLLVRGKGFLPVVKRLTLPGSESSQVVSSFLLWLPLASKTGVFSRRDSTVRVVGQLVSKPYVDITIDVLRWAGIELEATSDGQYRIPSGQRYMPKSSVYRVPGDYSSAAFLLAAACLTASDVRVEGLRKDCQGDRKIVNILRQMGAHIVEDADGCRVFGKSRLQGVDLDCSEIPDLVPVLSVLGAFAEGETTLRNIGHLRYKETNRLVGPTEELAKLGARIRHTDDSIQVAKSRLRPSRVDARGDHRLAMSLIVAAIGSGGAEVCGTRSIAKSYPNFLRDISKLGASIEYSQ